MGIVAGSGIDLRPLLDEVEREVAFDQIAGLAQGSVPGHACRFILGWSGGRRVILQSGRLHLYEGFSPAKITQTVDALQQFGAGQIVFTNAVGALRPMLRPGSLVVADSVYCWPCRHWKALQPLSPTLALSGFDAVGRYAWMHGPCYETAAEIKALRSLGCATVGMSSAIELEHCQRLGIGAGIVSCVTNICLQPEVLSHQQVVSVAQQSSQRLCRLLRAHLSP